MNDVSHHEASMRFLYGYVVRKNISLPARDCEAGYGPAGEFSSKSLTVEGYFFTCGQASSVKDYDNPLVDY